MTNDDDDRNKKNKKQSDKLKKMLGHLKSPKNPPFGKPNSENIFDMIRSQNGMPRRKKYSAEIIQLHPDGELDFTGSEIFHDVTDEAYFEGYSDAEENLKEQLDAVKTELEKVRSLLASVKHIVSVDC